MQINAFNSGNVPFATSCCYQNANQGGLMGGVSVKVRPFKENALELRLSYRIRLLVVSVQWLKAY